MRMAPVTEHLVQDAQRSDELPEPVRHTQWRYEIGFADETTEFVSYLVFFSIMSKLHEGKRGVVVFHAGTRRRELKVRDIVFLRAYPEAITLG